MSIEYKYVDQTDPNAASRGREEARREEEEREEEEKKRLYQKELKGKEREVVQMRQKLRHYKFGHMVTIKAFENLHISDMEYIRIVIIGPFGGGKTSFIGTVERALYGPSYAPTAIPQSFGTDGTVIMEEYLNELDFHLVDTRGLFDIKEGERDEIINILNGKIQPGDTIKREDEAGYEEQMGKKDVPLHKQIHAVVFVFKSNDVRFLAGQYTKSIRLINDYFRSEGFTPITVITGDDIDDVCEDPEELKKLRTKASETTGSPPACTYTIKNYLDKKEEESPEINHKALSIIQRAIVTSEKYVEIQKQREKYNRPESEDVMTAAQYLEELKIKHSWRNERVDIIKEALENQGVTTLDLLQQYWGELEKDINATGGMKNTITKELKKLQSKD